MNTPLRFYRLIFVAAAMSATQTVVVASTTWDLSYTPASFSCQDGGLTCQIDGQYGDVEIDGGSLNQGTLWTADDEDSTLTVNEGGYAGTVTCDDGCGCVLEDGSGCMVYTPDEASEEASAMSTSSGGTPSWVWVVVAVVGALLVSMCGFFLFKRSQSGKEGSPEKDTEFVRMKDGEKA